jgi:flagellar basal body-associated protein FliL
MKNSNKFWIIVSLIVVFAAGVIAGVLFDNKLLDKRSRRSEKERNSVRFPTIEMIAEELSLTEEQQEKFRQIFRDNEERLKNYRAQIHEQYGSLRAQLKKEIDSILTEEQQVKFQAMIDKYLLERKKQMEERDRRSKGHERDKGEHR